MGIATKKFLKHRGGSWELVSNNKTVNPDPAKRKNSTGNPHTWKKIVTNLTREFEGGERYPLGFWGEGWPKRRNGLPQERIKERRQHG